MGGEVMRMLGHKLSPEALKECIDEVDGDGSGFVDLSEFMELMTKKTKEMEDEKEVREAFRVLDKDGKGTISAEVIKEILLELDPGLTSKLLVVIFVLRVSSILSDSRPANFQEKSLWDARPRDVVELVVVDIVVVVVTWTLVYRERTRFIVLIPDPSEFYLHNRTTTNKKQTI